MKDPLVSYSLPQVVAGGQADDDPHQTVVDREENRRRGDDRGDLAGSQQTGTEHRLPTQQDQSYAADSYRDRALRGVEGNFQCSFVMQYAGHNQCHQLGHHGRSHPGEEEHCQRKSGGRPAFHLGSAMQKGQRHHLGEQQQGAEGGGLQWMVTHGSPALDGRNEGDNADGNYCSNERRK
jgi:hypothetical protein